MTRRHSTHRPLELSFLFDLFATGQLAITLSDEAVARYGIADGFAALSLIRSEGAVTPGGLAERLGMPATTASGLVRRLLRKKLVRKLPHPVDGRSYLLALTARGEQSLVAARPSFRALIREIESNLEMPVEELRVVLLDLNKALRDTAERRALHS